MLEYYEEQRSTGKTTRLIKEFVRRNDNGVKTIIVSPNTSISLHFLKHPDMVRRYNHLSFIAEHLKNWGLGIAPGVKCIMFEEFFFNEHITYEDLVFYNQQGIDLYISGTVRSETQRITSCPKAFKYFSDKYPEVFI